MNIRVKTVWFKKAGARPPEEVGSVIASTIWRVADKAVIGLSKSDYDIITPERGVRILAEIIAFLTHYADRQLHGRVPEENRVRHSLADISKARTRLGYEPTHRIGEGLAEAMDWYVRDLS